MRRRVAITGLGAVTPVGNDVASTWEALVAGRSGLGPLTTFDSSTFSVRIAGLVKDFDPATALPEGRSSVPLSRAAQFGFAAAAQALAHAEASPAPYEAHERGVALGGSAGRMDLQELVDTIYAVHASDNRQFLRQPPEKVWERDMNGGLAAVAALADCQGPMIGVSTACSASAHALGEAYRCIQEGDARLMITGGFDSLTTYLDVLGFALLGALNSDNNDTPTQASRPFDDERHGFVLGEGATVVILEDWESAVARGAPILAEVVGYGSSMNAYRMTDAPPDGGGPILAIASALRESGLRPDEIDYVVAHGTGTPGNDLSETNALKAVFGAAAGRLAISSPKSMVGHLTAASGSLNLLVAVCALRDQIVPPTINLVHPDPKLDLDYVPHTAREMTVRAVVTNAFAFGGTNAAMVVRAAEKGVGG